jgi:predicted Zn-dependent protease
MHCLAASSALACGCFGLAGCAVNPATGEQSLLGLSSINDDIRLGTQEYAKTIAAFGGPYENARLQGYVNDIGRRVAVMTELPDLPYEFTILNSPIVNAFALPGGKITVSRGLMALASSEAELAGVLAHEAGHVNARHTAQRQTGTTLAQLGLLVLGVATGSQVAVDLGGTLASGLLQGYSREQESEADSLGIRYMTRAGYDPSAMDTLLASMREQAAIEAEMNGLPPGSVDEYNIMASHPRLVERVRDAAAQARTAASLQSPRVAHAEYLEAINGLLFDEDPQQGVIRGRRFVHLGGSFAFEVPEGFRLRNSPENVVAQSRTGAAIVFDSGRVQRARNLMEFVQYEWMSELPLDGLQAVRINGFSAATGYARAQTRTGVIDVRVAAFDIGQGLVHRFLFLSPPQYTQALGVPFRETAYSYRRTTEEDTRDIRPLRVIVTNARPGDTVASLARSMPYRSFNENWFRVLNDLQPNQEPTAGQALKIVTS